MFSENGLVDFGSDGVEGLSVMDVDESLAVRSQRRPSTRGNVAPPVPWLTPGHYRYRGRRCSCAPEAYPWVDKCGKKHPAINPPKSKEPRYRRPSPGTLV